MALSPAFAVNELNSPPLIVHSPLINCEEEVAFGESVMMRDPLELFAEFYEQQNGSAPDEVRLTLIKTLLAGEEGIG